MFILAFPIVHKRKRRTYQLKPARLLDFAEQAGKFQVERFV